MQGYEQQKIKNYRSRTVSRGSVRNVSFDVLL